MGCDGRLTRRFFWAASDPAACQLCSSSEDCRASAHQGVASLVGVEVDKPLRDEEALARTDIKGHVLPTAILLGEAGTHDSCRPTSA